MNRIFIIISLLSLSLSSFSQDRFVRFSLDDVIRISRQQSPDAIAAKNQFRASYWQNRSFKANYLPSINFSGTVPNFNRSIQWNSSTQTIVSSNSVTNLGQLYLSQNISPTGGNISLLTNLNQINYLGSDASTSYLSVPVSIAYSQPLFGFNSMKWERKIQPLVYEEAKRSYIETMEQVSLNCINRFFDLALAQLNLKVAQINYSNNDTLYKIAQGRYNIGTIAENDVLQQQLAFLNSKTALNKAEIDVELQKSRLRSFLGYNEKLTFELQLPDSIPNLEISYDKILNQALRNNPDVISWNRRLTEARRDVAQAKGQRRAINLNASYGLDHNQTGVLSSAYKAPFNDNQMFQVGIQVPIIDWGRGRGKVKVAESNQELTSVRIEQAKTDFEQNIFVQVMQFNLQDDQVTVAAKADTIAQKRYDVTKQRFLIGKIAILDLNVAQSEKDQAKRGYISALRDYWNYYFLLRQLTLSDLANGADLKEDLEGLIE
jgi:outer membrane protein